MSTAEEAMYKEAKDAVQGGQKERARDLLSRLIKLDPGRAEYWLWMSAAVATRNEQVYCLREAQRLEPGNKAARYGLILLGELPPDKSLAIPLRDQKRNWQKHLVLGPALQKPPRAALPWRRGLLIMGAGALVIGLVSMGVLGSRLPFLRNRLVQPQVQRPVATAVPAQTRTPTEGGPPPLALLLKATYTPTPLSVNTPHPRSEAYRMALRAYGRAEWDSVIEYIQQVGTLEPQSADLHYYLGEAYRQQEKFGDAAESYNRALALDGRFAAAWLGLARLTLDMDVGRWREADNQVSRAIGLDPSLAEAYLFRSEIALSHNDPQRAHAALDMLETLRPDSMLLHYYRAQAYQLQGGLDAALAAVQQVQKLDITFLPAYRLTGELALALERLPESIEALKTYTLYQEEDAQAWAWLAQAQLSSGQTELAVQAFSQAIQANPRLYDALLGRGLLYLEQERLSQAESDLVAASRVQTNNFAIQMALGKLYLAQEKWGKAYMAFSTAEGYLDGEADKAAMLYFRAQSLVALNEVKAARRDYLALLELSAESLSPGWAEEADRALEALTSPTPALPTRSPTVTALPSRTPTASRTATPTRSLTPTLTPSQTATYTNTPTPTGTITRRP